MKTSLYVDPISKGYLLNNSKLIQYPSAINKANCLLLQPIGSNIYAMSEGNPLLNSPNRLSLSQITSGINLCLQPLITNGDILSLNITKIEYTYKPKIFIDLTLPNGTIESING